MVSESMTVLRQHACVYRTKMGQYSLVISLPSGISADSLVVMGASAGSGAQWLRV